MHFFRVLAVFAVGLGLATVAVAPASAANATATENSTGGDLEAPPGFEYQLTDRVRINDWSYDTDAEEFTITMTVDPGRPAYVSMAEAVNPDESGVFRANIRRNKMEAGRHTFRFAASPGESGEAAMTIGTTRSMENGHSAYISTGDVPQKLPVQQTGPAAGWLGGLSVMLVMTVAAGVHTIRHTHSKPRRP